MNSARVRTVTAHDEPVRILIVDDDQYFRQMLKIILMAQGYDVMEARSTNEGESFLRHRPDLAIVDYRLPGTDGAVWIKTLRDRGYKFPIVFCSGSSYSSQVLANLRNVLQVELIVRKPISPREFVNQLETLLPQPEQVEVPGLNAMLAQAETQNIPLGDEQEKTVVTSVRPEYHLGQASNVQVVFNTDPAESEGEPLITDFLGKLFTAEDEVNARFAADDTADWVIPDLNQKEQLEQQNLRPTTVETGEEYPGEAEAQTAKEETEFALRELSQSYLADMPSIVQAINADLLQAHNENQIAFVELAATHAHSMRGTAGSLGFFEISKIAAALEDRLRATITADNLLESVSDIQDLVQFLSQTIVWEQNNQNTSVTAYRVVAKPMTEKPQSAGVSKRPMRVLVIDDGFGESNALCLSLRNNHQCETVAITDPMKVLSLLDQYKPQLLFIGTNTDGKTGYDLCRMIRLNQKWWDLPLIIMTEDCSVETRVEIFDSGATDYVSRPIIESELRARLNAHLYGKK